MISYILRTGITTKYSQHECWNNLEYKCFDLKRVRIILACTCIFFTPVCVYDIMSGLEMCNTYYWSQTSVEMTFSDHYMLCRFHSCDSKKVITWWRISGSCDQWISVIREVASQIVCKFVEFHILARYNQRYVTEKSLTEVKSIAWKRFPLNMVPVKNLQQLCCRGGTPLHGLYRYWYVRPQRVGVEPTLYWSDHQNPLQWL